VLQDAKVFDFHYDKEDFVKWQIMGDQEYIGEDQQKLQVPDRAEFKRDLNFDPAVVDNYDYNIFSSKIFSLILKDMQRSWMNICPIHSLHIFPQ
jgi:hypothetical protein